MRNYSVNGQTDIFGNTYWVDDAKPAKPTVPKVEQYPFQCNIWTKYVIVYAQHERQAYAKCKRMYGCCIGTPIQIG